MLSKYRKQSLWLLLGMHWSSLYRRNLALACAVTPESNWKYPQRTDQDNYAPPIVPCELCIGLTRSEDNWFSVPWAIIPQLGRLLSIMWIFLKTAIMVNAEINDYLKTDGPLCVLNTGCCVVCTWIVPTEKQLHCWILSLTLAFQELLKLQLLQRTNLGASRNSHSNNN